MTSTPVGERFSQLYLRDPSLLSDNKKMRRRIGLLLFRLYDGSSLRNLINSEVGSGLRQSGCATQSYWPARFVEMDLCDVMDSITIVAKQLRAHREQRAFETLTSEAARIFEETNVRYRVDELGGVHFKVDTEFERVRLSTVSNLGQPRYENVQERLEEGYAHLNGSPPNYIASVRSIFAANECLFRLIFPQAQRLGKAEINANLKPRSDSQFAGDSTSVRIANKQISEYTSWVEGAHFTRHEQGNEAPVQPPESIAIQTVTSGTAWLRWLRQFDT